MDNDLISRSALIEETARYRRGLHGVRRESVEKIFEYVKHAPAVDAEPVRHARWLPTSDDNKQRCSRCDVIHLIAQYPHGQAIYCPNCGAKMDEEE